MNQCANCKYIHDGTRCKRVRRSKGLEFELERTVRVRAKVGKHCPLFEAMGLFEKILTR